MSGSDECEPENSETQTGDCVTREGHSSSEEEEEETAEERQVRVPEAQRAMTKLERWAGLAHAGSWPH